MLTPASLLHDLVASCRAALPDGTHVLTASDPDSLPGVSSTWCELWIDRWSSPPYRTRSPTYPIEVSVVAHAFGRPPILSQAVQQLAESLRTHLTQLVLPVSHGSESSGHLRLGEAELRDLSRPASTKSAGLLQWTISVRGLLWIEQTITP